MLVWLALHERRRLDDDQLVSGLENCRHAAVQLLRHEHSQQIGFMLFGNGRPTSESGLPRPEAPAEIQANELVIDAYLGDATLDPEVETTDA
jgi:hypothetical protein